MDYGNTRQEYLMSRCVELGYTSYEQAGQDIYCIRGDKTIIYLGNISDIYPEE